ncbi:MAG: MEDS domain-containing protein [Burkholderiaceae bacterium]|jgi:signal transduction histidine kinase|nr:MEDS domain-containing protein [Burkholderiaceae bacterium]
MLDILVPFFAAGLRTNELCLWVTSAPLDLQTARVALERAVPDLRERMIHGQIELIDGDRWYKSSQFDATLILQQWTEWEQRAQAKGFEGLRLTGNTLWVHKNNWDEFTDYERRVNEMFRGLRVLAMCTYHMDSCNASEVLDVVRNHEFAIARRNGEWEMLESASVKIAKDALREANAELESRVENRTRALEMAVKRRDEFLAMLAHELRNPLAPIRSASELIRRHAARISDASLASTGAMLDRQVAQLAKLVDELLDVARVTQGKVALDVLHLDIALVIEHALESVRHAATQKGLRVSTRLPGEPTIVMGDRHRLLQVFANLVDNAIKFTPQGGSIAIDVERDGASVVVQIEDSGIGIDPSLLHGVFEPFSQLGQSMDRPHGGLGLGLTVVQRLVDMHGGQVTLDSAGIGSGVIVRVKLPIAEAASSTVRLEDPRPPVHVASKRLLIVDDNVDAAESLALLLRMHGHDVTVVHDGPSAIGAVNAGSFDAVLLDLGLPGMDGYEVARRISSASLAASPRLIALSGYSDSRSRQMAARAGFDEHLAKPAGLSDVLHAIEARQQN